MKLPLVSGQGGRMKGDDIFGRSSLRKLFIDPISLLGGVLDLWPGDFRWHIAFRDSIEQPVYFPLKSVAPPFEGGALGD